MTPTDLETLRGQIDLRFQSGNSIQVSDVRLIRAEWEALTAPLAERDALRDRIQQFADDCNNSKATFDGQYVANELNSILRNEVQK